MYARPLVGAFLDRGRYGLRVVLLRIAPLVDFLQRLATLFPVFLLARRPAVAFRSGQLRAKRDAADGAWQKTAGRPPRRPRCPRR